MGVLVFAVIAVNVMAAQQSGSASRENRTVRSDSTPAAQAEVATRPADNNLPVRRVVLYKSGVGFFEHQGQIQGNQTVSIDFTNGQLDDVLQSLTLLDLNGGRIAGVDYNSEAPLSQRLGTLDLPLGEKTDIAQFYGALRGVRLQIKGSSGAITGRLLSMERKTRVSGGTTLEVDLATVVSDSGEVRTVEITPAVSVQVAERDVSQKIGQYLSLLSSAREQELRRLNVATLGTGNRQLYLSYISEVPVWKTTYRIVLPSRTGDQPLLQGWAIVDNTIGEDWNNVELSLVAGAPQSFIQPLSQPYYVHRPVVALTASAQTSPQTHEGAMFGGSAGLSGTVLDQTGGTIAGARVTLNSATGASFGSTSTDALGRYSFGDVPAGDYMLRVESMGFQTEYVRGLSAGGGRQVAQNVTLQAGTQTQTVTVTATAPSVDTEEAELGGVRGANVGSGAELGGRGTAGGLLANGRRFVLQALPPPAPPAQISQALHQMESAADGTDLGDLFQYKLKDRVTIHKNESALVPILQAHMGAEKVSLWNASEGLARPLRALWITNSSGLTLDGGSFSVLEDETFAGEGLMEPIKPGEKRLVSYAVDLGVRVDKKTEGAPQRVTRVRITHGEMIQTSEMRQKTLYTIRNDDTSARDVLIEHPLRQGWSISASNSKPAEATASLDRFRVNVDSKQTEMFEITESQPIDTRFALTNVTSDQITVFIQQKSITPEVEAALRRIVQQKEQVDSLNDEVSRRDDETEKIFDDQQRLRENLKALKGSQEERSLTQRYTQQLAAQETRLETLKRESADFQAKSEQAQKELDDLIQNLDLDETI